MQKHLAFFIALFIGYSSIAQVNLDSLWGVWNDKSQVDTNRFIAINKIVLDYMYNQPDSAFYFSGLQYDFAKSIDNKNLISKALNNLGSASMRQHNLIIALEYHNKSLIIAEEIGDKKLIAKTLGNIGNDYMELDQIEEALLYHNKTLAIAKEINDKRTSCIVLRYIGHIYIVK